MERCGVVSLARSSESLDKMDEQGQPIGVAKECRRLLRMANETYFEGITMDAVKAVLSDIGAKTLLVVVLDEFDRLESAFVRQEVADTIKYLSDRNVPCTVVLVGVSDDVDGLIADHRSIERCLAQVNMPRNVARRTRGDCDSVFEPSGNACGAISAARNITHILGFATLHAPSRAICRIEGD